MPFKMIANRHVYRIDDGKEYKKGEPFTVLTEKDRDRLLRTKRASLDETKEAPTRQPVKPDVVRRSPVVQRVMIPDEPMPAAAESVASIEMQSELPKPNRYRRSDMRSED